MRLFDQTIDALGTARKADAGAFDALDERVGWFTLLKGKPEVPGFPRRGEIRDLSFEGQHDRIAGMSLLAASIGCWNSMKLGEAVAKQKGEGKRLAPDMLAQVSAGPSLG